MSAPARWTIAITCLLFAAGVVSLHWTMPLAGVSAAGTAAITGFLLLIAAACVRGPLQAVAGRLIAVSVFAMCVGYIVSEIGRPLPTLRTYRHSGTNPVNAVLAFCTFGLPAGYFALKGRLPDWSALGRDFPSKPDENEDREEEEGGKGAGKA